MTIVWPRGGQKVINATTLWALHGYGEHEEHERGYWFRNHDRQPQQRQVIQLTLAGSLRFHRAQEQYRVPPGQAVCFSHDDGSEYGMHAGDPPYRCFFISLSGAGLAQHWRLLTHYRGGIIDGRDGWLEVAMRDLLASASAARIADDLQASFQVHRFVYELLRRHSEGPDQTAVDRGIARLRANPIYGWSLKQVAAEAGCSREHLSRCFAERYGISPGRWLAQERLAHASRLLRETHLSVASIAEQAGFGSAHSLARQLRQHYGCGPRTFRQRDQS